MTTTQTHLSKKIPVKQKQVFGRGNPTPLIDSLFKKKKLLPAKRLSPFILCAMALPPFTLYTLVTGMHIISSLWLQVIVCMCIEVYLLFFDFALWNYFEGKKIMRIWAIELVCAFLLLHFLL